MKKTLSIILCLLLGVSMTMPVSASEIDVLSDEASKIDVNEFDEAEEIEIEENLEQAAVPSVSYRTHVQTYGWQDPVADGTMSGTQGQAKRLEGIEIRVNGDDNLGIRYKTHIQMYGWETDWKENGTMSGTSGESKRLEAIRIELTGADAANYDVWYCVHAQQFGWLDWARNGADAGTAGYSYRLEGIKIRILPKGSAAPAKEGSTTAAFYSKADGPSINQGIAGVAYNTHVQTYGWQDFVYNGDMAGTSGQSKRLEGIHIALVNQPYTGGIEYRTHVQTYGWQEWKQNGQMSGTSGESKRLEGIEIRLTGEMSTQYDVYYRVHAQTYGWLDWAKNGEMAGTSGLSKRLEGISIVLVRKGEAAPGNTARPSVIADDNHSAAENVLRMKIGDTDVAVDWENNESVEALKNLCRDGSLTIQMSMYGGFEQVGSIGQSLPRNDSQTTAQAGDIVLYSGNRIVVFYGSNSWAYTRLGHIRDKSAQEMAALLGNGDVTITLRGGNKD